MIVEATCEYCNRGVKGYILGNHHETDPELFMDNKHREYYLLGCAECGKVFLWFRDWVQNKPQTK